MGILALGYLNTALVLTDSPLGQIEVNLRQLNGEQDFLGGRLAFLGVVDLDLSRREEPLSRSERLCEDL